MLRLVLILSGMVAVGLSCTCGPMDFKEEFCTDDLDVPVVAVKIIPEKKKEGGRTRRAATDRPPSTTPPSYTTSPVSTSPQEKIVTVLSKVTYIYRQGTEIQATKGQRIYLSSSDDDGMCGMAGSLQEGKQYILKMSRYSPDSRRVYMCDFFVDRNGHNRLGNPHKFFKKKNLCKKKKKSKKNKDKKNKGD